MQDGALTGCGGWTLQRPGAPDEKVDVALAHLRHFAVHPDWKRRGIVRALFDRGTGEARAAGVRACGPSRNRASAPAAAIQDQEGSRCP